MATNNKTTAEHDPARSLATKEGLAKFLLILNAQEEWRGMTKTQRAAVRSRLHGPVARVTLAALERRGLVENGLLTGWGDVVRHINMQERS